MFGLAGCSPRDTAAGGTAPPADTAVTRGVPAAPEPPVTQETAGPPAAGIPAGGAENIVSFGPYEWRVLAVEDGTALLITEPIISRRMFDTDTNVWEHSGIRSYLNGDFLNSFSAGERERMV
uniref:DUF6273 domain-containing protein n=1 Tax=uncultured bacterium contig00088 TaxID=1181561 RepID=A0A806KKT9_9BACT|nr:hypothetical protein [uncultured bacterium contig00088]